MIWSFLAPLYFIGAMGLAIPIIVHLRNRNPVHTYPFPTLRFLLKTSISSHKRRNILRWIILALRLLAFTALVLAFAQPWKHLAVPPSGKLSVLLLDTSCSAQAGSTWTKLQSAAVAWLESEGESSRNAIVTMGKSAKMLHPFTDGNETQISGVRSLKPSYEASNPEAALRFADQVLRHEAAKSKTIYILSDLTATSWQDVQWTNPLSPGIQIKVLPCPTTAPDNVGIIDVHYPISFWQTNSALQVSAVIQNFSKTSGSDQKVTFQLNQEATQTQKIYLAPQSQQEVVFSVTPHEWSYLKGTVQIAGDAFTPDDTRYFVIKPMKTTRVGRLSKKTQTDLFLKTALMPYADSNNRYDWVSINLPLKSELKSITDILLLDQGENFDDATGNAIKEFMKAGGSILMFCGEADSLSTWETSWLPIQLGNKKQAGTLSEAQHFTQIQSTHPILRPFFLPKGGDLFRVGVKSWRSFRSVTAQSLITLTNDDPIFSILPIEQGQIILFAFPLTREWSDWPIQATFLPFLHQTLGWLDQKHRDSSHLLVGDASGDDSSTAIPGFIGSEKSSLGLRAVNIDPRESDFTPISSLNFFETLKNPLEHAKDADLVPLSKNSGKSFAWWMLLATLLFSLSELALSNRTPR